MARGKAPGKLRRLFRWTAVLLLLALVAVVVWLRNALYNRFVRFPKREAAWANLRSQRQPVLPRTAWKQYRGILHAHSEFSHDSEIPQSEILAAMKKAGLDFICLSDHATDGRADFNLQWRGLHDGKLFIPGFEMSEGVMPFGVTPGVVLSNKTSPELLAKQITANGGVMFFAHPEEPRKWEIPELTGMEIYNIHADFKQQKHLLRDFLPEVLINQSRYPEQTFRLIFRRPTEVLKPWDELNRTRHLTGIAGNDCHQNIGFRATYTTNDTLLLESASPKKLAEHKLNRLTRPLAKLCFGKLEPNTRLFQVQLDPYDRMARYVNTHVLARELNEKEILDALRAGRVFVGFDLIADSSDFLWLAQDKSGIAVMGESRPFKREAVFKAFSPLPCRFTVLQTGVQMHQIEGRQMEWKPPVPGKYRVEAELKVLDEWVPWVYANPIELK